MKYKKDNKIMSGEDIIIRNEKSLIINPTKEEILKDGWVVYKDPTPRILTIEERIEQAKKDVIHLIEEYDKSDKVNAFIIGGKKHWLDYTGRCKVEDRFKMDIKDNVKITPLSIDGEVFPISPLKGLELINILNHYATKCYDCTENHKHNIKYTLWKDHNEVRKYDYITGYPKIINFDIL